MIQENRLKNVVFYVKYKDMTSRPTESEEITLNTLEPVSNFKLIGGMKNPIIDHVPKLTSKWTFEFFDKFKVFLDENIGMVSKRPIGCVIQKLVQVPEHDTKTPYSKPDIPFSSYFKEIQERALFCIVEIGVTV